MNEVSHLCVVSFVNCIEQWTSVEQRAQLRFRRLVESVPHFVPLLVCIDSFCQLRVLFLCAKFLCLLVLDHQRRDRDKTEECNGPLPILFELQGKAKLRKEKTKAVTLLF